MPANGSGALFDSAALYLANFNRAFAFFEVNRLFGNLRRWLRKFIYDLEKQRPFIAGDHFPSCVRILH
jgi:hypothetical protein